MKKSDFPHHAVLSILKLTGPVGLRAKKAAMTRKKMILMSLPFDFLGARNVVVNSK